MRVIKPATLRAFAADNVQAATPIEEWLKKVKASRWTKMPEITDTFTTASIIDAERVVFNIGGNRYRLVVKVWLPGQVLYVKFIGTHAEYDTVDVTKL